eukprot:g3491.t1
MTGEDESSRDHVHSATGNGDAVWNYGASGSLVDASTFVERSSLSRRDSGRVQFYNAAVAWAKGQLPPPLQQQLGTFLPAWARNTDNLATQNARARETNAYVDLDPSVLGGLAAVMKKWAEKNLVVQQSVAGRITLWAGGQIGGSLAARRCFPPPRLPRDFHTGKLKELGKKKYNEFLAAKTFFRKEFPQLKQEITDERITSIRVTLYRAALEHFAGPSPKTTAKGDKLQADTGEATTLEQAAKDTATHIDNEFKAANPKLDYDIVVSPCLFVLTKAKEKGSFSVGAVKSVENNCTKIGLCS